VFGEALAPCCTDPIAGFYRDGYCRTGGDDEGIHVVCAEMTPEFLDFSKSRGNDLSTPMPQFGFDGLRPGDRWCLCAARWKEAYDAGYAPPVVLQACHISSLEFATLEELSEYATEI